LGLGAEEGGDDNGDSEEEEEEEDSMDENRKQLRFRVPVSHDVCRRWRTVAIETSTLWTFLDFAEVPILKTSNDTR
jgi:hypothetical protein